jgi:hypothetical protein
VVCASSSQVQAAVDHRMRVLLRALMAEASGRQQHPLCAVAARRRLPEDNAGAKVLAVSRAVCATS